MVNTTVPVTRGGNRDADPGDAEAYDDGDNAAYDLGAQDGCDIVGARDGLHAGHVGKADAHDDGQGAAKLEVLPFYKRKELEQGADGGAEESGLDQDDPVAAADARDARDDDGGRDASHDHGDHVLESQRESLPEGGDTA